MKKQLLKMLIMCFLAISILSCNKDDGGVDYKPSVSVPDKIAIIPPKSMSAYPDPGEIIGIATKSTKTTEAYMFLYEDIGQVRSFIGDAKIEMMILGTIFDEVLKKTNGQSGSVPANTFTVNITGEMKDLIYDILPEYDFDDRYGEGKEHQEDIPALDLTVYNSDSEGDGYKYKVIYDKSYVRGRKGSSERADYMMTIKWSSDKNKVCIEIRKSFDNEMEDLVLSDIRTCISHYDASKNTMRVSLMYEEVRSPLMPPIYTLYAFDALLKETGQGNNEIYIDSRGTVISLDDFGLAINTNFKLGRADDNSGMVKMDYHAWYGVTSVKEIFDNNGNVSSHSESEDGINWIGDEISDDFNTYVLDNPNITLTGFTPSENKVYNLIITTADAPNPNTDLDGFAASIIGSIIYEKSANIDGIINSSIWKPLNSVKVYEKIVHEDEYRNRISEYIQLDITVSEN